MKAVIILHYTEITDRVHDILINESQRNLEELSQEHIIKTQTQEPSLPMHAKSDTVSELGNSEI